MSRTILDIHILQTVPPSNLNRDDTGSPKTATYGGVRRARVSSQAWKRATREAFRGHLDSSELGVRTRRVVALLAERIAKRLPVLTERADELATKTLKEAGIKVSAPKKGGAEQSGALLFLSERQIDNLADAAVTAAESDDVAVALKGLDVKKRADTNHSVDLALFGRMAAEAPDLSLDASCQVAHAISVHAVETEYDYYTAVDDRSTDEESGAGMIGTVEFNSATLYRYATLDVDRLQDNLGDHHATQRAVEAFLRSFITSMPTGKQNTFANRTLPDAVVVKLREAQPISFVGAYEQPVTSHESSGRIRGACESLARYSADVEAAFDEPAVQTWVVRVGDATAPLADLGAEVSMPELIAAVDKQVDARVKAAT